MKRLFSFVISLAVIAGLFTGCGTQKQPSGSEATTQQSTTTQAESTTAVPKKAESIRYMTWSYADRKASIDLFVQTAQEKLNTKIELENFPTAQYEETIRTKGAANELPELVEVHGVQTGYGYDLLKLGFFLPLNDLGILDSFIPEAASANTVDGKTYCLTQQAPLIGVLYNKKVFRDAGLSVPKDRDEFAAVCEAFKAKGITPLALGAKDDWSLHLITILGASEYALKQYSLDDAILRFKNGEIKLDSPEFAQAVNVMLDYNKKGWFQKNPLGTDVTAAGALLANGQAAMHVNGTWQYSAITGANASAEIGFFPLPLNNKGDKLSVTTFLGGGVCVNALAEADKLEASKEAIKLYYSADMLAALINDMKGMPTHKDVKVSDAFISEASQYMTSAILETDYENGLPGTFGNLQKENVAVFAGTMTVDKMLKDAQKKFDETKGK